MLYDPRETRTRASQCRCVFAYESCPVHGTCGQPHDHRPCPTEGCPRYEPPAENIADLWPKESA